MRKRAAVFLKSEKEGCPGPLNVLQTFNGQGLKNRIKDYLNFSANESS